MGSDVIEVWPLAAKIRVWVPVAPVMRRPVKVARPSPSVVRVAVPARVPSPDAIAAVTATPLRATSFPDASRNCTTGWRSNGTPMVALPDGCVRIASEADAPVVAVAVNAAALTPVTRASTRFVPGAEPSVHRVAARPLPSDATVDGETDPPPAVTAQVT